MRSWSVVSLLLVTLTPSLATASSLAHGIYEILPSSEVPAGSTLLAVGFQLSLDVEALDLFVDGEPVDFTVRGVDGPDYENVAVIEPVEPLRVGQRVVVEQEGRTLTSLPVGQTYDTEPSAPFDAEYELGTSDSGSLEMRVFYGYEPSVGWWQYARVRMYADASYDTLLADFVTEPDGAFVSSPAARVWGDGDPRDVCYEIDIVNGYGRASEVATTCLTRDARDDSLGCRVGGQAGGTLLGMLLPVLWCRRRSPTVSPPESSRDGLQPRLGASVP